MKVDFASDNQKGTNLKDADVKYRDQGEVVNPQGDYLSSKDASTEEIMNSLTPEQEALLLFGMKDAYELNVQ